MKDITPLIPKGKKIIESYGDGNFTINGDRYSGSIIIFPDMVVEWEVVDISDISIHNFSEIEKKQDEIEILLIGSGEITKFLDSGIENDLRKYGMTIDVMDTGAACRTYNVLLSEERKVAVALIAV